MNHLVVPILFALAVIAGCASIPDRDSESRAQRHWFLADTLEREGALREATMEYSIVAEHYPGTRFHADAVRRVALLSMNPLNPAASDSVSMAWLRTYLALSVSVEEKENARMYITLLQRIGSLRGDVARQQVSADSMAASSKRATNELALRAKRIQDLENELKEAKSELERLREVDIRISRSKGKK
jgi:hypothetical protein